jgi:hypothetical protein
MINDDSPAMFADHMNRNTYKILGRKELLLVRHQDMTKYKLVKKSGGVFTGLQRERIKTYEVEVKYKRRGYPYSKQVWYLDPEQWMIHAKLLWDEDGVFWRFHEESYQAVQSTVPGEYAYNPAVRIHWDMQGRHASYNFQIFIKDVGKIFPGRIFTVHHLPKGSY